MVRGTDGSATYRNWEVSSAPQSLQDAHRGLLAAIKQNPRALSTLPHPATSVAGGPDRLYAGPQYGRSHWGPADTESRLAVRRTIETLAAQGLKHGRHAAGF